MHSREPLRTPEFRACGLRFGGNPTPQCTFVLDTHAQHGPHPLRAWQ
jgi:hypothetical protein